MPRRKVEFAEGEIYHLFNRGVGRSPIFIAPENYYFFTTKCWSYSRCLNIPIIAICLMPNHYHLVVRQNDDTPAGKLTQRVCNSYSKAFNHWMNRTGTLFEGRYRAKHVISQDYIEQLCAYVHLNPVRAGLVGDPAYWPYSDFHRWIEGKVHRASMSIHSELGLKLGGDYRRFVDDVLSEKWELPPPLD